MLIYLIPFNSVHYCVFVMTSNNIGLESGVLAALAPFDDTRIVRPYRVHLPDPDVIDMAAHFEVPPAHLHELAKRMEQWTGRAGGVDDKGLYQVSINNPDGRWDWYEIGGRWDGQFAGENSIGASVLADSLTGRTPDALVTPAGEWLQQQHSYFYEDDRCVRADIDDPTWRAMVSEALQRWPDHLVVCVDIHC